MEKLLMYLVSVVGILVVVGLYQLAGLRRQISDLSTSNHQLRASSSFAPSDFTQMEDDEKLSLPSFQEGVPGTGLRREVNAGVIYTDERARAVDRHVEEASRVMIREYDDQGRCTHTTWALLTETGLKLQGSATDTWVQEAMWLKRLPSITLDG